MSVAVPDIIMIACNPFELDHPQAHLLWGLDPRPLHLS